MTLGFRQHSPAVLDAQLGEDDGERHIAAQCDEHDDCDPHLQLGADEDAGRHHIEELRHDVEQDCTRRAEAQSHVASVQCVLAAQGSLDMDWWQLTVPATPDPSLQSSLQSPHVLPFGQRSICKFGGIPRQSMRRPSGM